MSGVDLSGFVKIEERLVPRDTVDTMRAVLTSTLLSLLTTAKGEQPTRAGVTPRDPLLHGAVSVLSDSGLIDAGGGGVEAVRGSPAARAAIGEALAGALRRDASARMTVALPGGTGWVGAPATLAGARLCDTLADEERGVLLLKRLWGKVAAGATTWNQKYDLTQPIVSGLRHYLADAISRETVDRGQAIVAGFPDAVYDLVNAKHSRSPVQQWIQIQFVGRKSVRTNQPADVGQAFLPYHMYMRTMMGSNYSGLHVSPTPEAAYRVCYGECGNGTTDQVAQAMAIDLCDGVRMLEAGDMDGVVNAVTSSTKMLVVDFAGLGRLMKATLDDGAASAKLRDALTSAGRVSNRIATVEGVDELHVLGAELRLPALKRMATGALGAATTTAGADLLRRVGLGKAVVELG